MKRKTNILKPEPRKAFAVWLEGTLQPKFYVKDLSLEAYLATLAAPYIFKTKDTYGRTVLVKMGSHIEVDQWYTKSKNPEVYSFDYDDFEDSDEDYVDEEEEV